MYSKVKGEGEGQKEASMWTESLQKQDTYSVGFSQSGVIAMVRVRRKSTLRDFDLGHVAAEGGHGEWFFARFGSLASIKARRGH